jgi:hypothetical protein
LQRIGCGLKRRRDAIDAGQRRRVDNQLGHEAIESGWLSFHFDRDNAGSILDVIAQIETFR